MSDPTSRTLADCWPRLVDLSGQLQRHPQSADQQELIRNTAASLLGATVSVWLDPGGGPQAGPVGEVGAAALSSEAERLAAQTGELQPACGGTTPSADIAAPIASGERLYGVMRVRRDDTRPFGPDEIAVIEAVAVQAAVGIESARHTSAGLLRSLQQAWASTAAVQVAGAVQAQPTLDRVLATGARLVPLLVGATRSAILLRSDAGPGLELRAAYGLHTNEWSALSAPLLAGQSEAIDELLARRMPLVVQVGTRLGRLLAAGFRSSALLPLTVNQEVFGVLVVEVGHGLLPPDGRPEHGGEEPPWIQVVSAIGRETAIAVERHRLRQGQQEEAYVATALLEVAKATASLTSLEDVLTTIVRLTPTLVGSDQCLIYRWSDSEEAFLAPQAYGVSARARAATGTPFYCHEDFRLLDAVRESRRPQVRRYPSEDSTTPSRERNTWHEEPAAQLQSASRPYRARALPLLAKGNFVGAMMLVEPDARGPGQGRRDEILRGIADQAAIAIHNDLLQAQNSRRQRLEQEMAFARDIQLGLMPKRLPEVRGWQLAGVCRPAQEVGGDFFDVFELPRRHLGLVVADVADKGMPAALYMASARAMIRALVATDESPSQVLKKANDLLLPDSRQSMFVTAFYAVLSIEGGSLTYCSAGHCPALVWRAAKRQVERLETGGVALGVIADARLGEHFASLGPGDWLVLYTDGVTEAFSAGSRHPYGEDRLRAAIAASAAASAQGMTAAIERSVGAFVGNTPPSDDITVLVARRIRGTPIVA